MSPARHCHSSSSIAALHCSPVVKTSSWRTTRHVAYAMSQHARPRIELAFGWLKTIAWIREIKLCGLAKVDWLVVFASPAFNLIRLPKLLQPE